MSWLSRLKNALHAGRLDRDLDEELQFHMESRIAEFVRQGMSPRQAEREARRRFGNALQLRESSRDVKLMPWLESVLRDIRFGLRMLWKDRIVSGAALLSLSLAIGACAGAFSLIDALILRPLPVDHPGQLIALTHPSTWPGRPDSDTFSYPFFGQLHDVAAAQAKLFPVTFGGPSQTAIFGGPGNPEEKIYLQRTSTDAFRILGIKPALGRLFEPGPARREAILSYIFWTRRFGADPGVLGRWVTLSGKPYQIVGVAEKGFSGLEPGLLTDLWAPIAESNARTFNESVSIWGRLKPGVAPEQTRQVLQAAFTNFRREHSADLLPAGTPRNLIAAFVNAPLHLRSAATGRPSLLRLEFSRPLWILGGVALLVLLIACSNVANLFLARAAAREREMAMRISIGAGRARLIQQLLIEGSLLSTVACLLGIAFASIAAPSIVSLLSPAEYPAYLDLHLDWRVLAFVVSLGAVVTLLFGMVPAIRASAASPNEVLKTGAAGQSSGVGLLRPLTGTQVGFSFVVLFLSGLLLLSFHRLTSVDLGFAKKDVLLFTLRAPELSADRRKATAVSNELLERIRQMPSVQAAAQSGWGLVGGDFAPIASYTIRLPGRNTEPERPYYLGVSPGFFETMQIRMLEGRDFLPRDDEPKAASVVIVNQSFTRRYFRGESALGKRFERREDKGFVPQEIVGVVRDSKYNNVREPPAPTVYVPLQGLSGSTLEVRTAADPRSAAPMLRREIERVNPAVHVAGVTLQSTRIDNTLLRERLLALLSGFFGFVAIALAGIGLYGVLTYAVVRRTKEIGIRLALGAGRRIVVRAILADLLLTITLGLAAGIAGGLALARYLESILFEVKPSDFASVALPLTVLLSASTLAALSPAIRATRVDPLSALRQE